MVLHLHGDARQWGAGGQVCGKLRLQAGASIVLVQYVLLVSKESSKTYFFFSRGPEVPLVSISEIYTYYLHIYNGYSHLFLQIVK